MLVVVLGSNGVGSRSHCVTGYHGPGCIWLDTVCSLIMSQFLMLRGKIVPPSIINSSYVTISYAREYNYTPSIINSSYATISYARGIITPLA